MCSLVDAWQPDVPKHYISASQFEFAALCLNFAEQLRG
jgi:hypothetical protein